MEHRSLLRSTPRRRRQQLETRGGALLQQFLIRVERFSSFRQPPVVGVELPHTNAIQPQALEGDPAIPSIPGIEVGQAIAAGLEPIRSERRLSGDHHDRIRKGSETLFGLLVQPLAQALRLIQNLLRGHAPLVGSELQVEVMPPRSLPQQLLVLLRQLAPGLVAREVWCTVEQSGLELNEAGKAGHQPTRLAVAERRAEKRQQVSEG